MPTLNRRFLTFIINLGLSAVMVLSCRPSVAQQDSAATSDTEANSTQSHSQWQNGRQTNRAQNWQQQRRLAAFVQYLGLTDDQKRQFMQIQKETGQSIWAARHDDSLGEEQMQQKIKQIHADQRQKILALLTPDQQELLKKWNEEQKQKQAQAQNPAQVQDATSGSSANSAIHDNTSAAGKSAEQSKSGDDDFFAGMVQDPDPPSPPQRQAAKGPKN